MTTPATEQPKIDDGGDAFPCTGEGINSKQYFRPGMSLRDYFAAAALTGFISSCADQSLRKAFELVAEKKGCTTADLLAEASVKVADAMLAARKSGGAA
jgi:hypothetical protein